MYRKNGSKPSSGCITSDQFTSTELQSNVQQPKSPVNYLPSSSTTPSLGRSQVGHQSSTTTTVGATPASSIGLVKHRLVEKSSHANPSAVSGGSGHVWYPSNTPVAGQPFVAGASITNAPLKVAFNKSIGGGVLV